MELDSENLDPVPEIPETKEEPKAPEFRYFPFKSRTKASVILFLLAVIFYAPSINNEYALDDGILIHQNSYVLKGMDGIPEIISTDTYNSFYKRMNATDLMQGGRYRPLPSITYAIEQEIIGPYRTGFYQMVEDNNRNGILDLEKVDYYGPYGKPEHGYEFNNYVDLNGDEMPQPNECFNCWDQDKDFMNDPEEDVNNDGIFNEVDCQNYFAGLRHFNNIWIYAILCVLLYLILAKYLFREQEDFAFLTTLLFLIHPIHSEVVANIRGRDDLFSLIFILLTFMYAFKFFETKNVVDISLSAIMFFLSLMSKEYAVMLIIILPLAVWTFTKYTFRFTELVIPFILFISTAIAMIMINVRGIHFLFNGFLYLLLILTYLPVSFLIFRETITEKGPAALMICLYATGIIYLGFRLNAVSMTPPITDTELLNNPYIFASGAEAFATKIYTLLLYLKLFFLPHPLLSDYSYSTIAYQQLTDPGFVVAILLHLVLLVTAIFLVSKRHVLGFALVVYLLFIFSVSNLFIRTGPMMSESYLFHASVGGCLCLAWLILKLFESKELIVPGTQRSILIALLVMLMMVCGIKCWERSMDWKNDVTLFLKDVNNAPNSVLILGNAGARWIDLADTKEITGIITPGEEGRPFNDYNGTLKITDEEVKEAGYTSKREAALYKGINYLKRAVELHPNYVNGFLNLGLAYYKLSKDKETLFYWKYAEYLYPNNPYLYNYYQVYGNNLRDKATVAFNKGDYQTSLKEYKKLVTLKPLDENAWYEIGNIYSKKGDNVNARSSWKKALIINPGYKEAREALGTASSDR